jgi:hypothetical protein
LLPKKIKDLQRIRRDQEKSIAMLTKELEEINRIQREKYGMLMEEATTKLQRGRKRKIKHSTSTKVYEDSSSQENTPEVKTTYGGIHAAPSITRDAIGSLLDKRDEKIMPPGCQRCKVIDTGMSDGNTDNNQTLHIC